MARAGTRSRLRVRRVLGESFRFWGTNFVPFTIVCLIVFLPPVLVSAQAGEYRRTCKGLRDVLEPLAIQVSACLLWVSMPAALITGVSARLRGARPSIGGSLRAYARRLLPVLRIGLLVGLVGFPSWLAVGFGADVLSLHDSLAPVAADALDGILLVVVGAALSCLFLVAVPVAAVENRGALESLRRSMELTRGVRDRVFFVSLVMLGIQIVPLFALDSLLSRRLGRSAGWVEALYAILLTVPGAIASAVAYLDLRGSGAEDAARVFR